MGPDALDNLLANMSEETLATWYVSLNQWQWPQDIPVECPAAWASASTDAERMRAGRLLWEYLKAHTSPRSRSRAWWLVVLRRTPAEWEAYWSLPLCPICELRHAGGTLHTEEA